MLDRLISGAGALTDRADRLVRALTSGRGPDVMGNRPGSVLVIVILIVVTVVFGLLSIESTDNPTPRAIAPAEVATADDLGRRVYATIEGGVQFDYVETYEDADGDGTQDADETGDAWYYWLVDESGRGVTVRSTRNPDDIYRYTATGVLVRDPGYMSEGVARFSGLEGTTDVQLEDIYYIEMRDVPQGKPQPIDLVDDLPAAGTLVTITGPSFGFFTACSTDLDGDGFCEDSEYDEVAWFVGDADAGRAITVLQADLPRTARISFTGMLRSEAASILDAQRTEGLDFESLGITVSDRYLLDDQATPANGALSLGVAIIAALLAAILAVGLVGGYLVFRRLKRPLPSGGRTMGPGDEIPIRVTGALRREGGMIHVREAKSRLLRFPLEVPAEPVASVERVEAPAVEGEDTPAVEPEARMTELDVTPAGPEAPVAWETPATPAIPSWSSVVPAGPAAEAAPEAAAPRWDGPTTLIVERLGKPEGVALGKGELKQLVSGRVMPFRGPRPALRVQAGTGTLLLSFDSKEARDRAAAELIGEAGLLIRDTGIAASPG